MARSAVRFHAPAPAFYPKRQRMPRLTAGDYEHPVVAPQDARGRPAMERLLPTCGWVLAQEGPGVCWLMPFASLPRQCLEVVVRQLVCALDKPRPGPARIPTFKRLQARSQVWIDHDRLI